jgi:hypothetical protein
MQRICGALQHYLRDHGRILAYDLVMIADNHAT